MKVLVIFGSKSDKEVYEKVAEILDENSCDYELRIASAHKTPELVEKILTKGYKVIIAGAGLAAHLPGVIAAKKLCPVIGVPCEGAYNGLDAFLSVAQMPPGIPVLSVGVGNAEEAANSALKILKGFSKVNIVNEKTAKKTIETLKELNVEYKTGDFSEDAINIAFVEPGDIERRKEFVIYCPVKENTSEQDAIDVMKMAETGLWVGVNRKENAAVAAAEILGKEKELKEYRAKLKKKIIDADNEVRK